MDNIELQYITHKNKSFIKSYIKLAKPLLKEFYYQFLNEDETKEIARFITFDVLKEEIKNNEYNYYLIKKEKEFLGILRTKKENDVLSITRLHLLKKYRKQKIGTKVIEILKQNIGKNEITKLKLPVITSDNRTKTIIKKWDFKPERTIARYLGNEIYLYEDLFFYSAQD